MFIFIFMYGVQVMRGVMEEKQNRVVEVLISSVKPFQLMMGKIIGIAMVGFVQFMLWIAITVHPGQRGTAVLLKDKFDPKASLAEQLPADASRAGSERCHGHGRQGRCEAPRGIGQDQHPARARVFLFYFIWGYLLYSSLLAAIGSAVDSERTPSSSCSR
jgi:ABC-2 type transport system permease protein